MNTRPRKTKPLICTKCGAPLVLHENWPAALAEKGRRLCRSCQAAYQREWRAAHPDYDRKRAASRWGTLRPGMLAARLERLDREGAAATQHNAFAGLEAISSLEKLLIDRPVIGRLVIGEKTFEVVIRDATGEDLP